MLVASSNAPTALALGRDPAGDAKTAEVFAQLGQQWLADGVEDGVQLCQGLSRFFTYRMATSLKQLRAQVTHAKLKEAYTAIELDPIRWAFMSAALSESLALEFVTPVPSAGVPPTKTDENCRIGRGGHRVERFSADGETPIGYRLRMEGRLKDPHIFAEDFHDLNLPLKLRPVHKISITTRCIELIAERQGCLKMDDIFAEELGSQVTAIHGPMPMTKTQVRLALESAEHVIAGGAVLFSPPLWADAIWTKLRNVKKTNAAVRPCSSSLSTDAL
jgi:hypothetical protein